MYLFFVLRSTNNIDMLKQLIVRERDFRVFRPGRCQPRRWPGRRPATIPCRQMWRVQTGRRMAGRRESLTQSGLFVRQYNPGARCALPI